jgi:hypothetical protein
LADRPRAIDINRIITFKRWIEAARFGPALRPLFGQVSHLRHRRPVEATPHTTGEIGQSLKNKAEQKLGRLVWMNIRTARHASSN